MGKARRSVGRGVVGVLLALGIGALGACLLADPPADLPVLPIEPPAIETANVTPSVPSLLQTWPSEFDLPVVADPSESELEWEVLIDHIVVDGPNPVSIPEDGGVFLSSIPVPFPLSSLAECHTLEIFVFYENDTSAEDSVVWFYSPTGNFDDCPVWDAGVDAASDDAAGGND
jgi:hypothetical protein